MRHTALLMVAALWVAGGVQRAASETLVTYDLTPHTRGNVQDVSFRHKVWDELQCVASLQGIVNRNQARLYVTLVGEDGKIDRYWLKRLREPGTWLEKRELQPVANVDKLVAHFRRQVRGVVVWDERVPATANVASTIAGVDNLIPLRYDASPNSLYQRLTQATEGPRLPIRVRLMNGDGSSLFTGKGTIPDTKLPSTGSAKCDAYLWAAEKYLKTRRCDPTRLGYYPDAFWLVRPNGVPADRTLLSNHDFFIARRGFFFDLSPWDDEAPDDDRTQTPGTDAKTLRAILRIAYEQAGDKMIHVGGFTPWDQKYTDFTGGKHGGVDTEWRYAEILSCFNAYMDADAPGLHAMANASLFQHFPLKKSYLQPNLPTEESLKAKGWLDADGHVVKKTFVSIYVGDYDSAAWLYQRLPDLWDDPARGTIPLGWAFNPNLADRFPVGMDYTRRTASQNDTFIAGDSGAGYLNPGNLEPPRAWSSLPSGLSVWEKHCLAYYRRWNLSITGFVIDGYAPGMSANIQKAYARFSPGGVVAQKIPEQSLLDGVPFLRMGYDLVGSSEQGAETIANRSPKQGPGFAIYRTILWSPSGHRRMFERLKELRPDIEVVEPHTLFLLLKYHLRGQQEK